MGYCATPYAKGVGARRCFDDAGHGDGGTMNDCLIGFIVACSSLDAIEESEVLSCHHSTEFGRGSGGAINIPTRSHQ